MAKDTDLSQRSAWVEGEAQAQELIFELAKAVQSVEIPTYDEVTKTEGVKASNWQMVYESRQEMWVTYQPQTAPNTVGKYKHTDGKEYTVYKLPDLTSLSDRDGVPLVDPDTGILTEKMTEYRPDTHTTSSPSGWYGNIPTDRELQCVQFSYDTLSDDATPTTITKFINIPGALAVSVEDPTKSDGYTAYVVRQIMTKSDGTVEPSDDINEYEIITELPTDWHYVLSVVPTGFYYNYQRYWDDYYNDWEITDFKTFNASSWTYKFGERFYTADPTHSVNPQVVLKATPEIDPALDIPSRDYYVLMEQPVTDYNYFDIRHGVGFEGQMSVGDPTVTYSGICDLTTVKPGVVPTIIDQTLAHEMYLAWNDTDAEPLYTPPKLSWEIDYDGETELVSPASHFFHGRNSTTAWLPNKKRRPDYLVGFSISVNNDRLAIILEGDPSPSIHDYYRSFGYVGKIRGFNKYDHMGNFGITVGMGDLDTAQTGYVASDIREDMNPDIYAKFGEYTSNGMYSMSMYRTRSNVLFQSYYPAFITQLPNYPAVGTIPPELSKLMIDKTGFQKSHWTDRYHASPIYMVHVAEGYRGFLDGVVAIHDHNLVNKDELLVDTEILKDPDNPGLGTWTEVYKFFSIKSPINFFKKSPSPDVMTVAILKEIK